MFYWLRFSDHVITGHCACNACNEIVAYKGIGNLCSILALLCFGWIAISDRVHRRISGYGVVSLHGILRNLVIIFCMNTLPLCGAISFSCEKFVMGLSRLFFGFWRSNKLVVACDWIVKTALNFWIVGPINWLDWKPTFVGFCVEFLLK